MGLWEILLLGVGLAMDAFAASVCEGLAMGRFRPGRAARVGGLFGLFQAVMPLIGFAVGKTFEARIARIDHWAAFVLLGGIGIKMIWDSREAQKEEHVQRDGRLLLLAFATSIDALAVGVTLAFLRVDILAACALIGMVTAALCVAGVALGRALGRRARQGAQTLGGTLLVSIGIKILLSHLLC